ncbi:hypothetical protein [Eubacterium callanderi]|uniref:hypothetical protein n=1 Tax=Eubacterium callanderi TaxID=53442 RepID=UPI0034E38BA6
MVEKHNGTIRVDSQVGEGTNVIVTLPVIEKALAGGEKNEKEYMDRAAFISHASLFPRWLQKLPGTSG